MSIHKVQRLIFKDAFLTHSSPRTLIFLWCNLQTKAFEMQDLWVELVMDPSAPEEGKKSGLIHLNVTYIPYESEEDRKNSPVLRKPLNGDHGDGFSTQEETEEEQSESLKTKVKNFFGMSSPERSGPVDPDKIVGDGDLEEHTGGRIKKSGGTGF